MNGRLLSLGVASAIAVSAVLTGCGTKTVTQSSPSSVTAKPVTPTPSASSGGRTTKVPITKKVAVAGKDRTLTVPTFTSGCKTVKLVAGEAAASVTLTVVMTDHHKPGHMCPAFAKLTKVSTTLKAPLGDRKVIDATTGKQLTIAD